MQIKITIKTAGYRLDKFLSGSDLLGGLSRNQIQKLIEQGMIKVNDAIVSSHYSLKAKDKINIVKRTAKKNLPTGKKTAVPVYNIPIIGQTDEFAVINKPAGLAVHGPDNYTLADWLREKHPKIKKVGDDPERPGIVHRLDKDVSGLMVIAKTQDSFNNLKQQFQNKTITKEYTALVHGKIQRDDVIINFPIKRAAEGYKMAAMPLTSNGELTIGGRPAETRFQIINKYINFTLLKVKIITGRTHQIRVHLAAYGHPVVGDNIYGTTKSRLRNKKLNLNRIFLIADKLSFTDLAGEQKNYKIGLTEELKKFLKQIK